MTSFVKGLGFLLSRFQVLSNTRRRDTLYYNRVTLVDRQFNFLKNPCWVHETATDILDFPIDVECSCKFGTDVGCEQENYIAERCSTLCDWDRNDLVLVDFGSCRCLAAVCIDGVYLFSTMGRCTLALDGSCTSNGNINHIQQNEVSVSCVDCQRHNVYDSSTMLIQRNNLDYTCCGLTLLEHFAVDKEESAYKALLHAQEVAYSIANLEGLLVPFDGTNIIEDVDLESLHLHANELIARCKRELISLCSSLIGEVNSFCQAPLKVHLRWLKHACCLEYLVEYSADLSHCFYDEFSGRLVPDLSGETVVLHEFLQCSLLTRTSIEGVFHIALNRLSDYLGLRRLLSRNLADDIVDAAEDDEIVGASAAATLTAAADSDVTTQTGSDAFTTSNEISPYWWSFYRNANTYGESDTTPSTLAVVDGSGTSTSNNIDSGTKRLTRSQIMRLHEDDIHTPTSKKRCTRRTSPIQTCDFKTTTDGTQTSPTTPQDKMNSTLIVENNDSVSVATNVCGGLKSSPQLSVGGAAAPTERRICYCSQCIGPMCSIGRYFDVSTPCLISQVIFADNTEPSPFPPVSMWGGANTNRIDYSCLKRSILAAVEAGAALGHEILAMETVKALNEHLKRLNTALLSTFRLGEVILTNTSNEGTLSRLSRVGINNLENANGGCDSTHSILSPTDCILLNGTILNSSGGAPQHVANSSTSTPNIEELLLNNRLVYAGVDDLIVFENDLYLDEEIVSEAEEQQHLSSSNHQTGSPSSTSLYSKSSHKQHKRKPSGSMPNNDYTHPYSQRDPPSTRNRKITAGECKDYIYDSVNLGGGDWYDDSDGSSSKKSNRSSQRRMPPSRPSVSNLSEIYGNFETLIPMGPLPIGVYFDASRKLWRCQWRENGKFRTKGFSLGHYNTLSDARHACIIFRCQIGNIPVQPEWLTPNYIQVSELLNKRSHSQQATPKKTKRKRRRSSVGQGNLIDGLEGVSQP